MSLLSLYVYYLMEKKETAIAHILHKIKHYLPSQAPLKDFIHHNTLHAFQHLPFVQAMQQAHDVFGYKTLLSLAEYRQLFHNGKIKPEMLERVVALRYGSEQVSLKTEQLLNTDLKNAYQPAIGRLRKLWKARYRVDMDNMVHPLLFRILCSYLDQGVSMWAFPAEANGFLSAIRELERNSLSSIFKSGRTKQLLLHTHLKIEKLLALLVGDERYYERYLFDQQFAHPGWSGMVATVEGNPGTLLDKKPITLHDLIVLELLMELDALYFQFGEAWQPLAHAEIHLEPDLFSASGDNKPFEYLLVWQEALEWSYYDDVLAGIVAKKAVTLSPEQHCFQALFCIDDRSCSIRRHIEKLAPDCETFGTPGFFNVSFYYKPEHGKFVTKLCPAPQSPNYLIKETGSRHKHHKRDLHFTKQSHSLLRGWIISQTLGFWSALRLFFEIFKPTLSPAVATSLQHMDKFSALSIEYKNPEHREHGLQVGFTINEMVNCVEGLLKSIGLIKNFAPLVYVVGHGSSSMNNPHYAAYDCGACSGHPGSVNARVICDMANRAEVRKILSERGISIPEATRFVAGLHDTTRDEMVFYDENLLRENQQTQHRTYADLMQQALDANAKERSRRFEVIDTKKSSAQIHKRIKERSVSLFEPRPELNHSGNALCIIGSRELTRHLFLDRRAFMNSYDYRLDPEGVYLLNILKAAAPVCGGINLEYYFSRVDNQKLGAGSKLPHNVMGLIGVANGIDGDLRPGLPSQMTEVHDPVRLLMVIEHFPEVVVDLLKQAYEPAEWFANHWIHLVVAKPESNQLLRFDGTQFVPYVPLTHELPQVFDVLQLAEDSDSEENIPVHLIQSH